MKLLLASNGQFLIDSGYGLLGIPKDQLRIGYVITAAKAARNRDYVKAHEQLMKDRGYFFKEFDIEDKSQQEIYDFFKDKNILHVEGGNTFYLLRAIKASGFDKIIRELLGRGIVYVGTSAGASIAGPTIEMSSHIPPGTPPEELIALNLVPLVIKAHYTPDKAEEFKSLMNKIKHPVKFLTNGQGLLVQDDKVELVGEGEEVKL